MSHAKPKFARLDAEPTLVMKGRRGRRVPLVALEDGAEHLDVHVNVLNVDSGPGPTHYHQDSENVYVVLSGRVGLTVDGEQHIATAGDVLFIPKGVHHQAGTVGDEPATLIEIYAPSIHRSDPSDFHIVSGGYDVEDGA